MIGRIVYLLPLSLFDKTGNVSAVFSTSLFLFIILLNMSLNKFATHQYICTAILSRSLTLKQTDFLWLFSVNFCICVLLMPIGHVLLSRILSTATASWIPLKALPWKIGLLEIDIDSDYSFDKWYILLLCLILKTGGGNCK